jgi:hypothetical protein
MVNQRLTRLRWRAFFAAVHARLHGFGQLLLVVCQKRIDILVGLVADAVDLRAESFTWNVWIFINECLNLLLVLQ